MNIVCCVKQVPDPETPARAFKVDEATKTVVPAPGIPPVISQFDQIGVEAALRIRDAAAEGTISVLSLGPDSARDVIKTSLAMGADQGFHLSDPALFEGDSYSTAVALVWAIKKLGTVDLVVCGRQSTDSDFGVTGIMIGELLGWPSVTIAKTVEVEDGRLKVQRVLSDSFETVDVPLPAVVTVSNELGEPRYPTLPQIMQAARKQVTVWTREDLGLQSGEVGAAGARLSLDALYVPPVDSQCEFIEGETPEEMAVTLSTKLRDAKVL